MADNDFADKLKHWREHGAPGYLRRQGTTHTKSVVTETGPRRGTVGGTQTEHWDGRVDCTVHAPAVAVKSTTQEI